MKLGLAEFEYWKEHPKATLTLHEKTIATVQAKFTAKQIYGWGKTPCPHRDNDFPRPDAVPPELQLPKYWCEDCWNELLEASK